MKKLLWLAGVLGVIFVVMIIAVRLNPEYPILAIDHSTSADYEELLVLKRDHTYEQLMRRQRDGAIFIHTGQWMPTTEDQAGLMLLQETGGKAQNYITIKDHVTHHFKDGNDALVDFMAPASMPTAPNEEVLLKYHQWRTAAKPYVPSNTAKAVSGRGE